MVFVHEAACDISDRTVNHYQWTQPRVRRRCGRQSWLPLFRFLLKRRRNMRLWSNDAIWLARRTEKHLTDAAHATCLFHCSSAAQYTCDWWTQE